MLRRSYTARWLIPITERQAKRLLNFYPLSQQWILSAVENLRFVWLGFFCTRRVYLPLFSYILSTSANAIVVWNAPSMGVKWTSNCALNDSNCLAVESHFSVPSFWGESRIFHLHWSIYRKCSYQHWNIHDKKILTWALCDQQVSDCVIYQLCTEGWCP